MRWNTQNNNVVPFGRKAGLGSFSTGQHSSAVYMKGKIYFNPLFESIDFLENIGEHDPLMDQFPSDLNDLSTSLYNKFHNCR